MWVSRIAHSSNEEYLKIFRKEGCGQGGKKIAFGSFLEYGYTFFSVKQNSMAGSTNPDAYERREYIPNQAGQVLRMQLGIGNSVIQNGMRWVLLGLLLGVQSQVFLPGCGEESKNGIPDNVITQSVQCTAVTHFGNGKRCLTESGDLDLALCGESEDVVCTLGRLCFDTAAARSCQCSTNQDCIGFTAYVNQARASVGQNEWTTSCIAGTCAGDVDITLVVDPVDTWISPD